MSLIKQLWIGIILLLLMALGGSFIISFLSAKQYLESQLQLKNIDNANSLALSISQMEKDPVTIELLITAQFDAGHYEYIIFNDPQSKPIVARSFEAIATPNTPSWFSKRITFNVAPGVAQIQDGWQQYGTILVKSHSGFAVETLWKNAKNLFDWFVIATLLGGLLGSFILKYVSRPLDLVIRQAEAISERRFIISNEPKTKEFQRLVRAMNTLSSSVKNMLDKEARQLEILRRESQRDNLTGLCNREHFLNILDTRLHNHEGESRGVMALARLRNLSDLNTRLGRQKTDELLRAIAQVFAQFTHEYSESAAGRLNGSDFILLIPSSLTPEILSAELSQKLNFHLISQGHTELALPIAVCAYHTDDNRQSLLHQLDGALAQAELKGNHAVILADTPIESGMYNLGDWRKAILQALNKERLVFGEFPVKQVAGNIVHMEAPLRLEFEDGLKPASLFMPWASRLGLLPQIDLAVVQHALKQLTQVPQPLAINISADALCNAGFRERSLKLLQKHLELTSKLWIDFPETCALRHMEELKAFCGQLRALGCQPGLEHVGLEFTHFEQLQDLGLSHLKIDGALVRDIHQHPGNQQFIQGLCRIGHSLGIQMIAEGVNNATEKQILEKLGLDGFTGPGIQ